MITGHAIHPGSSKPGTSEYIATADYDRDFDPERSNFLHLGCDTAQNRRVNTIIFVAQKRFATDFQQ
jgi:hypothetical protein